MAPRGVPARLLALVDALGRRYEPQQEHERAREQALARGERERDFTITVPASAADASEVLGAMLDEADDFCRDGDAAHGWPRPATSWPSVGGTCSR